MARSRSAQLLVMVIPHVKTILRCHTQVLVVVVTVFGVMLMESILLMCAPYR
jgi:hypothetical protein